MLRNNHLRDVREKLGLTLQQLADRAGIGRSTLIEIEAGVSVPRLDTAMRIASALGVDISGWKYLFGNEGG